MEEQLITLETGQLAIDKGFEKSTDLKCIRYQTDPTETNNWSWAGTVELYLIKNNKINYPFRKVGAITQSFIQDWLREEYNISVWVSTGYYMGKLIYDTLISYIDEETGEFKEIVPILSNKMKHDWGDTTYENKYSDALEKGLKEALPLIKNKVNLK